MTTENTSADPAEETRDGEQSQEKMATIIFQSENEFQSRVDEILKERLEQEKRRTEKVTAKAAAEAEAKALVDQKEFEKLAEKRAKRVGELEGQVSDLEPKLETAREQVERLEKALNGQLKVMKAGLPEATLELLKKLDSVEQFEYLTEYGGSLRATPSGGIGPTPRPRGATGGSIDEIIQSKAASGHYAV